MIYNKRTAYLHAGFVWQKRSKISDAFSCLVQNPTRFMSMNTNSIQSCQHIQLDKHLFHGPSREY